MGRLILRNVANINTQDIERAERFYNLSITDKVNELFALIDLSVKLNNNLPLKKPLGKGVVLHKKNGYL